MSEEKKEPWTLTGVGKWLDQVSSYANCSLAPVPCGLTLKQMPVATPLTKQSKSSTKEPTNLFFPAPDTGNSFVLPSTLSVQSYGFIDSDQNTFECVWYVPSGTSNVFYSILLVDNALLYSAAPLSGNRMDPETDPTVLFERAKQNIKTLVNSIPTNPSTALTIHRVNPQLFDQTTNFIRVSRSQLQSLVYTNPSGISSEEQNKETTLVVLPQNSQGTRLESSFALFVPFSLHVPETILNATIEQLRFLDVANANTVLPIAWDLPLNQTISPRGFAIQLATSAAPSKWTNCLPFFTLDAAARNAHTISRVIQHGPFNGQEARYVRIAQLFTDGDVGPYSPTFDLVTSKLANGLQSFEFEFTDSTDYEQNDTTHSLRIRCRTSLQGLEDVISKIHLYSTESSVGLVSVSEMSFLTSLPWVSGQSVYETTISFGSSFAPGTSRVFAATTFSLSSDIESVDAPLYATFTRPIRTPSVPTALTIQSIEANPTSFETATVRLVIPYPPDGGSPILGYDIRFIPEAENENTASQWTPAAAQMLQQGGSIRQVLRVPNQGELFVLSDIVSSLNYQITIRSFNALGYSSLLSPFVFSAVTRVVGRPSPPRQVVYANISPSTFRCQFNPPAYGGNPTVESFEPVSFLYRVYVASPVWYPVYPVLPGREEADEKEWRVLLSSESLDIEQDFFATLLSFLENPYTHRFYFKLSALVPYSFLDPRENAGYRIAQGGYESLFTAESMEYHFSRAPQVHSIASLIASAGAADITFTLRYPHSFNGSEIEQVVVQSADPLQLFEPRLFSFPALAWMMDPNDTSLLHIQVPLTGLTVGDTYSLELLCRNREGLNGLALPLPIFVAANVPSFFPELTSFQPASQQLDLTFTYPSSSLLDTMGSIDQVFIEIEGKQVAEVVYSLHLIVPFDPLVTTYRFEALMNQEGYEFRSRFVNSNGNGPWSDWIQFLHPYFLIPDTVVLAPFQEEDIRCVLLHEPHKGKVEATIQLPTQATTYPLTFLHWRIQAMNQSPVAEILSSSSFQPLSLVFPLSEDPEVVVQSPVLPLGVTYQFEFAVETKVGLSLFFPLSLFPVGYPMVSPVFDASGTTAGDEIILVKTTPYLLNSLSVHQGFPWTRIVFTLYQVDAGFVFVDEITITPDSLDLFQNIQDKTLSCRFDRFISNLSTYQIQATAYTTFMEEAGIASVPTLSALLEPVGAPLAGVSSLSSIHSYEKGVRIQFMLPSEELMNGGDWLRTHVMLHRLSPSQSLLVYVDSTTEAILTTATTPLLQVGEEYSISVAFETNGGVSPFVSPVNGQGFPYYRVPDVPFIQSLTIFSDPTSLTVLPFTFRFPPARSVLLDFLPVRCRVELYGLDPSIMASQVPLDIRFTEWVTLSMGFELIRLLQFEEEVVFPGCRYWCQVSMENEVGSSEALVFGPYDMPHPPPVILSVQSTVVEQNQTDVRLLSGTFELDRSDFLDAPERERHTLTVLNEVVFQCQEVPVGPFSIRKEVRVSSSTAGQFFFSTGDDDNATTRLDYGQEYQIVSFSTPSFEFVYPDTFRITLRPDGPLLTTVALNQAISFEVNALIHNRTDLEVPPGDNGATIISYQVDLKRLDVPLNPQLVQTLIWNEQQMSESNGVWIGQFSGLSAGIPYRLEASVLSVEEGRGETTTSAQIIPYQNPGVPNFQWIGPAIQDERVDFRVDTALIDTGGRPLELVEVALYEEPELDIDIATQLLPLSNLAVVQNAWLSPLIENGSTYRARARVRNDRSDWSEWTPLSLSITPGRIPLAPVNVSLTLIGSLQTSMTIQLPAVDNSGYAITLFRVNLYEEDIFLSTTTFSSASLTLTLNNANMTGAPFVTDRSYKVKVQSVNAVGPSLDSSFSNALVVRSMFAPDPPLLQSVQFYNLVGQSVVLRGMWPLTTGFDALRSFSVTARDVETNQVLGPFTQPLFAPNLQGTPFEVDVSQPQLVNGRSYQFAIAVSNASFTSTYSSPEYAPFRVLGTPGLLNPPEWIIDLAALRVTLQPSSFDKGGLTDEEIFFVLLVASDPPEAAASLSVIPVASELWTWQLSDLDAAATYSFQLQVDSSRTIGPVATASSAELFTYAPMTVTKPVLPSPYSASVLEVDGAAEAQANGLSRRRITVQGVYPVNQSAYGSGRRIVPSIRVTLMRTIPLTETLVYESDPSDVIINPQDPAAFTVTLWLTDLAPDAEGLSSYTMMIQTIWRVLEALPSTFQLSEIVLPAAVPIYAFSGIIIYPSPQLLDVYFLANGTPSALPLICVVQDRPLEELPFITSYRFVFTSASLPGMNFTFDYDVQFHSPPPANGIREVVISVDVARFVSSLVASPSFQVSVQTVRFSAFQGTLVSPTPTTFTLTESGAEAQVVIPTRPAPPTGLQQALDSDQFANVLIQWTRPAYVGNEAKGETFAGFDVEIDSAYDGSVFNPASQFVPKEAVNPTHSLLWERVTQNLLFGNVIRVRIRTVSSNGLVSDWVIHDAEYLPTEPVITSPNQTFYVNSMDFFTLRLDPKSPFLQTPVVVQVKDELTDDDLTSQYVDFWREALTLYYSNPPINYNWVTQRIYDQWGYGKRLVFHIGYNYGTSQALPSRVFFVKNFVGRTPNLSPPYLRATDTPHLSVVGVPNPQGETFTFRVAMAVVPLATAPRSVQDYFFKLYVTTQASAPYTWVELPDSIVTFSYLEGEISPHTGSDVIEVSVSIRTTNDIPYGNVLFAVRALDDVSKTPFTFAREYSPYAIEASTTYLNKAYPPPYPPSTFEAFAPQDIPIEVRLDLEARGFVPDSSTVLLRWTPPTANYFNSSLAATQTLPGLYENTRIIGSITVNSFYEGVSTQFVANHTFSVTFQQANNGNFAGSYCAWNNTLQCMEFLWSKAAFTSLSRTTRPSFQIRGFSASFSDASMTTSSALTKTEPFFLAAYPSVMYAPDFVFNAATFDVLVGNNVWLSGFTLASPQLSGSVQTVMDPVFLAADAFQAVPFRVRAFHSNGMLLSDTVGSPTRSFPVQGANGLNISFVNDGKDLLFVWNAPPLVSLPAHSHGTSFAVVVDQLLDEVAGTTLTLAAISNIRTTSYTLSNYRDQLRIWGLLDPFKVRFRIKTSSVYGSIDKLNTAFSDRTLLNVNVTNASITTALSYLPNVPSDEENVFCSVQWPVIPEATSTSFSYRGVDNQTVLYINTDPTVDPAVTHSRLVPVTTVSPGLRRNNFPYTFLVTYSNTVTGETFTLERVFNPGVHQFSNPLPTISSATNGVMTLTWNPSTLPSAVYTVYGSREANVWFPITSTGSSTSATFNSTTFRHAFRLHNTTLRILATNSANSEIGLFTTSVLYKPVDNFVNSRIVVNPPGLVTVNSLDISCQNNTEYYGVEPFNATHVTIRITERFNSVTTTLFSQTRPIFPVTFHLGNVTYPNLEHVYRTVFSNGAVIQNSSAYEYQAECQCLNTTTGYTSAWSGLGGAYSGSTLSAFFI